MSKVEDRVPSPLRLNFAIIPVLKQIAIKYPVLTIDGTLFDIGVGMLMSCRGTSGTCLLIRCQSLKDEEISVYEEFHTYSSYSDKKDTLPLGMRVYIHQDVLKNLEKDDAGNLIEFIDLIIININHEPPLIYAQIG